MKSERSKEIETRERERERERETQTEREREREREIHLTQVLVFNNARVLGAVGEVGELYLRSPHLAKGYMGLEVRSAETADRERQIKNEFERTSELIFSAETL